MSDTTRAAQVAWLTMGDEERIAFLKWIAFESERVGRRFCPAAMTLRALMHEGGE